MSQDKLHQAAQEYALGSVDTCHYVDFKAGAKWMKAALIGAPADFSMEKELAEQARLNGIGSQREAALMAKLTAANATMKAVADELHSEAYVWELEYPMTKWSTMLFKCAEKLRGKA